MAETGKSPEVVIVGAGPAGLTAAFELSKHGIRGTILEAENQVGGISKTVEANGFRFDLGGHRFFSKSAEIERMWDEMLSEPMQTRPRMSRIYYNNKFYDYPLKASNALRNMGLVTAASCMASYALARMRPIPDPKSFEEWVTNQFGAKLYFMFFKTYTEKVWGIPCSRIGADWAAQRIKGLSLGEAVRNAIFGQKKGALVKTLIEEFRYPRLGPGQLWEDCASKVQSSGWELKMDTRAVGVKLADGRATAAISEGPDGTRAEMACSHVVSSMPLRTLVRGIEPAPGEDVIAAANALAYRDFLTVAVVLDAADLFPDNWIYVHSPEVKLGRIQNYRNWSPDMVPDPTKTCLGLEYFCNEGDELWNSPDDALIELGYSELTKIKLARGKLIEGHVVRSPKAYPVYDTGYGERLSVVRRWASSVQGLYCVGRNGQHRYNNMDHSMMTALIAARNIALGESRDPWAVNEDAEYHETGGENDKTCAGSVAG